MLHGHASAFAVVQEDIRPVVILHA
jgi:hypothetical protein